MMKQKYRRSKLMDEVQPDQQTVTFIVNISSVVTWCFSGGIMTLILPELSGFSDHLAQ
jgi:hypothetical protein